MSLRLREFYASRPLTISVEFFPPRTPEAEARLSAAIAEIKPLKPAFCSVTYGAGGSTHDKTLDIVVRLKRDEGLEAMCHLTCIGQPRARLREILETLKASGIENMIALRGDPPAGETEWRPHPDGFRYSVELVREAASLKWFSIAVAGFPETHPQAASREADLAYLKAKVEAGADAVITQLFFDNGDFFRFVEDARRIGIAVPIIPGILPIKSVPQVRRFAAMCGAKIPAALGERLASLETDEEGTRRLGIDHATRQCEELIRSGVKGLHFYSLNESRAVKAILTNLRLT